MRRLRGIPAVLLLAIAATSIPMASAHAEGIVSDGVAVSRADAWHAAGKKGAGVKIGIIESGFGGLDAAKEAGELPAGLTAEAGSCPADPDADRRGTAVAEVVHDMAPEAELHLACAPDAAGFAEVSARLAQPGSARMDVIVSSFASVIIGRGDGRSNTQDFPGGTPDSAVRAARQAGVLWVAAAGDHAQRHLHGVPTDANANTWMEFNGAAELNSFDVRAGRRARVELRWDEWSVAGKSDLDVYVLSQPVLPASDAAQHIVAKSVRDQTSLTPTEWIDVPVSAEGRQLYLAVKRKKAGLAGRRFDLTVFGDASSLQYTSPDGGIADPAASDHAMAVGATRAGSRQIQPYSAGGATIDGRVKPDITGFDAVGTATFGPDGFVGTAAAAAHVAGAAALLKGANPELDAGEIEGLLERQAVPRAGKQQFGHGELMLVGEELDPARTPGAPAGNGYTALATPRRLINRSFGPGETFTLALPADLPRTVQAVMVSVTGSGASAPTRVDLTPEQEPFGPMSTLNLAAGETKAMGTIVRVGQDRAIRIKNVAGTVPRTIVDLFGYFSPESLPGYVPRDVPVRILDVGTGLGIGGRPPGNMARGEVLTLKVRGPGSIAPEVPADATAVAVAVTGLGATGATDLDIYPQTYGGTSNVNLVPNKGRSALALVGIGSDGAIRLRNSGNPVRAVMDLKGWFRPGEAGTRYVPLRDQTRVIDTRQRIGNVIPVPTPDVAIDVSGNNHVPYDAAAMAGNMVCVGNQHMWLGSWRGDLPKPGVVVDLGVEAGETNANGILTPLGGDPADLKVGLISAGSTANCSFVVDVNGYFRR